MKHFKQFFVFALLALFSVGAWGEEASFAPSDFSGQGTSGTGSAISATVDGVTFACDKGYGTTQFRCYNGGKITISSSNTITAIAFTFSGSYNGGMETSYTGLSTTSWEKTLTSQARITACTVTYSAGSSSDPVAVTGVSLDEDAIALEVGEKQTLTATVSPNDATNKSVTWESDDTDVATVVDGLVTAIGAGNATITAKTDDGDFTATCDVTVTAAKPKSSLVFTAACGGSGTADDGVEWTVVSDADESNFDSSNGRGVHYGTGSKAVSYIELTSAAFTDKITKIEVEASGSNTPSITVTVGGVTFGETVTGLTNSNVKYTIEPTALQSSTDFTGAVVVRVAKSSSATGALYVKSVVVYYINDGKEVAGLAYDAADAQKLAKVSGTLTAPTLTNPNSLTIAYASSNTDVVEVNASTGAITAIKAAGKAVITASSEEDATYKAGSATYTIFVATEAGTAEDPLTEASAKALIDDGCTLNAHVAGTVLTPTYYSSSKTYTVTLTDGFQFYKLKDLGNELFTSDYLKANDQLVVLGPLGKHNTTYQLGDGCYIVNYVEYTEPLVDISNTKATAYTVAQALALAGNPTSDLSKAVYIAGVVYQVNSFNSTNGTYNIYIKDAGTSEDDGKFEFYKCSGLYEVGGTPAQFAEGDVQIGDEVIGYGVMTYYSGGNIWEFGQPNQLVSLNRPTVPVTSINLTESTATVEEGKTVTLHASVLPNNATDQDIVWTVVSGDTYASVDNGVVTGIAAGEAVIRAASHEEASIYAECTVTVTEPAPLSPWATIYSSNVAMVHTGSGVDNGTITIGTDEPYLLVKAGASSNTGTIEVTIPAQTHTLHFHAFAWGGKTAKIQIAGVDNPSVTEFDLAGESGASGSGNDFTLAGDPIDQYFSVTFDAVATETIITFSKATGSADNRFFLYGVNQEGGVLPVLENIEISGDLDNKTGYKVGDDLDLDGLTVSATYSLGGVAQTPVDITDKLGDGLTLTYDPLVEGQTEVTITATYEGETDDINITLDEAVASADPKIYVDKLNMNFGTVAKDAVVADQTITVTLTNVAAATAVLGGTNPEAFSIDKTALVDGDVITISVASTATYGSYSAKITISDNAAEAEAKIVNLSLAVEDVETPVSTISKWVAAEAADLVDGAEVLITGVKEAVTYAMGVQNNNNRAAVAASVDGEGVLTPGEGTMAFTLVAQGDGTFALRTSNGKYLYAAASGSNHLKTQAEVDVNAKWTLTIASAVAEGSSNRNVMQFNSGSSLFSCYGTASQTDIALYTRAKEEREGFTVGKLATVCVPYAVAQEDIIGADVYEIAGKNEAGKIVFDQVTTGGMVAGVAYLVQAKAETATFYYSGNAVAEPQNEGKALKGTFDEIEIAVANAANVYFFKDNALWSAKETGVKILAYRAWLDMSAVGNAGPSPAPGRRRITMDVHGENAATGMDELNASEAPSKMIIDGKMYILRGEKMYNPNGILVK